MTVLWAFLKRDLRHETSYKLAFFMQAFGSIHVVLIFYFISKMLGGSRIESLSRYGGNFFQFIILGVAVQQYLYSSLQGFSSQLREAQLTGTLEAILTCPVRLRDYVSGSLAFAFLFNLIQVGLYLLLASVLGAAIPWSRIPAIIGVLLLSSLAFACFGILSATYILLFKKGNPLVWAITLSSALLGGVYYPVAVLPRWLQQVSHVLPMTHCLEALRALTRSGPLNANLMPTLLGLAAWILIGLPLAFQTFAWALAHARRKGTLGQY